MRSRWKTVMPSGRISKPPFGALANDSIARSMSAAVSTRAGHQLDCERRLTAFRGAQEVVIRCCLRVGHESRARKVRSDLLEHRQPLAGYARFVMQHTSEIPTRPR